jgi:hypothetical protein
VSFGDNPQLSIQEPSSGSNGSKVPEDFQPVVNFVAQHAVNSFPEQNNSDTPTSFQVPILPKITNIGLQIFVILLFYL